MWAHTTVNDSLSSRGAPIQFGVNIKTSTKENWGFVEMQDPSVDYLCGS